VAVQAWLQDGAIYGEEGPTLKLDSLMIQVAALRSKVLKILRERERALISSANRVRDVVIEAGNLDTALASWPQGMLEEWRFSVQSFADRSEQTTMSHFLFNPSVHSYTTHGHAVVWMRYRAVRLIVCSIRMRLLSILKGQLSIDAGIGGCQEDISSLATDMCYSVPYFFSSDAKRDDSDEPRPASVRIVENAICPERKIVPRIATLLAWPLAVAVSTEAVPKAQKEWLQRKLKTVARVQGDAALESIAETEEFKF
jgi:hypothetical protein